MKVYNLIHYVFILFFLAACSVSRPFQLRETPPKIGSEPIEKGLAPIRGIQMYYEIHGEKDGIPLVLLNGGGSTIEVTYSRILPIFAQNRKVIALDEQGHGRTTDRNAPVSFDTSAEDVVALLKFLKVEQADIFGFSNGASVALQIAIKYPKLVRKLVFASSITKRNGAYPMFWNFMKNATFENMPQALKEAFLKVNPDPQKLYTMYEKDAARMRNFKDLSDKEIRTVGIPTLILLGDRDVPKLEHAVEMVRMIPKARLLVLPGGHGDYLGEAIMSQGKDRYPELTSALIQDFLDSP
ncbi:MULTISPECIES: alpha/beta fold hydrolase [unclassified Leptospira]|uniref:alpha/beta fold hydrolase n=1 Tax=unclassified Leptospira TaxID=2633828 RepID=UPI0002C03DEA|nr:MULTISPECIES: alpha/beta hydrolase [unclassified Leptospira]EMJ97869.1 alpha/beta hydrolase family protein [Leptospira sp. B5-022]MCR1795294.1 alpha/beta hydrolase [Leptospira sp. id769339]